MASSVESGLGSRIRLRRALRDPAALVEDERAAQAQFLLRQHVIEQIGVTLAEAQAQALLVKGAAVALSAYPKPWLREMSDIDLIVRDHDMALVLGRLEGAGFSRVPAEPARLWTTDAFGEVVFVARAGAASWTIEVHGMLDKIVARPLPTDDLFDRSLAAPELSGLRLPSAEDHVLLIALHEAASEFRHPAGFVDVELLFRQGIDCAVLIDRARRYKLRTALYVVLATLRGLDAPSIPNDLVSELRPGRLRGLVLKRCYAIGDYPLAPDAMELGLPWIVRQTALRDDLVRWGLGVGRYAAQRALERGSARLEQWQRQR